MASASVRAGRWMGSHQRCERLCTQAKRRGPAAWRGRASCAGACAWAV